MTTCPVCDGNGEVYSELLEEWVDCLACMGSELYDGPDPDVGYELFHGDDETCDRPNCLMCAVREQRDG